MWKKIWKTIQNLLGAIERIRTVAEVVGVVAVIGVVIREWFKGIDSFQLALILVAIACAGIVGITYLIEWRRKRSIRNIPKLLSQMDEKIKSLIEIAIVPNKSEMEGFVKDIGEMWDIDLQKLEKVVSLGNKEQSRDTLKNMIMELEKRPQLQTNGLINNMLMPLAGIMNHHNIGLSSIKDMEYKILEKRLGTLQHRIKNAVQAKRLTNYILWADCLYNFLLLVHYESQQPVQMEIIPARAKAIMTYIKPIVDMLINILHTEIEESILGNTKSE